MVEVPPAGREELRPVAGRRPAVAIARRIALLRPVRVTRAVTGQQTAVTRTARVLTGRGGRVVLETTSADSGGRVLATRSTLPPGFPPPPRHQHPHQAERFDVLAGRLVVEAGGVRHLLCAGEGLTVPPGVPHRFEVPGPEPVDVRATFRPAGDMEGFLVRAAALERAGAIGRTGRPSLRAAVRLAARHDADLRLTGSRGAALRLTLTPRRALGRLGG